jgi:arsenate reductase
LRPLIASRDTVRDMAVARIFHNPRCSKSRGACELLEQSGVDHEVVRYLDDPPSAGELREIISLLGGPASALVRRDAHFRDLGIDPKSLTDEDAVVQLIVEHPRLMQRPVVILGGRAIIARPPELLNEVLAKG